INGFGTTVDHLGHSVRFKLLYERMGDDCQLVYGKMGVSYLWFPFFCLGVFKSLPQMAFLFF
ncbi:hypothetical protein LMB18_04845, partial [Limosilactobacillus reuteri]|nr:hypothetical protein [Limosilactobacillus reuteri]